MAQKQLKPEEFVKKAFPQASRETQSELLRYVKKYGVDVRDISPEMATVLAKALKDPTAKKTIRKALGNILGRLKGPKKA